MTDALHGAAVGFTAIAACLHPGWGRPADRPGLLAMGLMLAAMVDVAHFHRVGMVLWVGVLLIGAIGLAAAHAWRRRRGGAGGASASGLHDAFGLIVMATLLPMMSGGTAHGDAAGSAVGGAHEGHGVVAGGIVVLVLATAISHVASSAVGAVRGHRSSERLMHLFMGGATLLMTAHALVAVR